MAVSTYSDDPSANLKDEVRFLIGDTDSDDWQYSDLEINYTLTRAGNNVYQAAVRATEGLRAKYARLADKAVGDLRISYSQRVKHYTTLLADLRRRATIQTATPYAGGISIADKESVESNTDRTVPAFKRGMHDNKSSW